jgi:mercuric reductase
MSEHFPIVIIGGGSAGFAAATKANDLEIKTALINDGLIGGTCVNTGCVPSKYLLEVSRHLQQTKNPVFDGIKVNQVDFSFKKTMLEKNRIVKKLRQSNYVQVLEYLPNVALIEGKAKLVGNNQVKVGKQTLNADKIILAVGTSPHIPEFKGVNEIEYLTSTDMLDLQELPESLIVIGGRDVGLEFGQMFHRFGSKVTILQRSERILPEQEPEIAEKLQGYLSDEGIDIRTGVSIEKLYQKGDTKYVETVIDGSTKLFFGSHILMATGRKPILEGLGLENEGIETENGFIKINKYLQTSNPDIYAAGDCASKLQLETLAARMGNVAVRNAFEDACVTINKLHFPRAVFTDPQAAKVGYTEEEYNRLMGYCSCQWVEMEYVPKAQIIKDTRGMVKVGMDYKTNKLVGGQILSYNAAELIHELTLAIQYGHTIDDIIGMAHVFPTMSEGIKKANQAFYRDVTTMSCCIE